MSISRRTFVGMAGLLALLPLASRAQNGPGGFPAKPVRLVVPFAPGGGTDIVARLLGVHLGEAFGQSVVVENRVGAGGNLATEFVARAPGDGLTLLMVTNGQMIANPIGMKMSFSPEKEIALLGRITSSPLLVLVAANSPYRDIDELISHAKDAKGGFNYGSAGLGTPQHLGMEMLKHTAGFEATHIPYKGSSPALIDLMSGEVDVVMDSISASMPHVKAGKLRILAVTAEAPFAGLPEVPTLASHVPGVALSSWVGVGAPSTLPPELSGYLADTLRRVVTDPAFVQKLRDLNSTASWLGADDFQASVGAERKVTQEVMRRADIKLE